MSSSNYCFLTCIQISQEVDQVVWYSYLFKNFPQFVVIHTVKGFGIVSETEVDVFLELSCFFDLEDVGNLISGSSAFSKSNLNIWKFIVHLLLKPGLENFEHYFAGMWDECNCVVVWAIFGIAFLWDWNENWPFPVLWPLLSFPDLLAYFRIWNSSVPSPGIPSPPLALFVVMLSKAHLTLHSRMSGSRWVITPSWLSGSCVVLLCTLAGEHSAPQWQASSPGASVAAGDVHRTSSPGTCCHGGGGHAVTAKPLGEARVSCPIRGRGFVVKSESTAHPMSSSRKDSLVPRGNSRRKSWPDSEEVVCFLTNQRSGT